MSRNLLGDWWNKTPLDRASPCLFLHAPPLARSPVWCLCCWWRQERAEHPANITSRTDWIENARLMEACHSSFSFRDAPLQWNIISAGAFFFCFFPVKTAALAQFNYYRIHDANRICPKITSDNRLYPKTTFDNRFSRKITFDSRFFRKITFDNRSFPKNHLEITVFVIFRFFEKCV